ncbi:MAG TPA: helix-turn-helix domain-containing protein [Chitinophagaceae bacterium]|jgi:AraC-like DNA-binding protein|nr:helix-turn-helix domain-containing protein [Chitinophagaceae bacterium]
MSFSALFSFAVLITGCIVIAIILNKHKDLPSRLLALSLFSLNFTVLLIFLFESRYILNLPFLFRTGSLFYYLVIPSFYLYAAFVIKSRKYLRWSDALHLLPAALYFVDFSPLFFSSTQHKLAIIQALLGHGQKTVLRYDDGWFMPPGIHFLAPIIIGFTYLFFVAKMLFKYSRSGAPNNKPLVLRWLVTATSLYFLLGASSLLTLIFTPKDQWLFSSICVMTFFFLISLVLFSNPDLLYGHYLNAELLKERAGKKIKPLTLSSERMLELKEHFEKYVDKEFYLNSDVDRKKVASFLNIPPHVFSTFIGQAYGANFNDVVNRCRINYVEEGLKKAKWTDLTLEAIAEKAGFNNRVTFLTAFKKFTGTTPTQYLKNLALQRMEPKASDKPANKLV